MVAISVVESQKENISPNPDGYRLSDLHDVFNGQELTVGASASSASIDDNDDSDPLAYHLQTIRRIRMKGPFVGASAKLLTALESCLHKFAEWEMYKNDPRYVRLWLEYSTFSRAPHTILHYMEFMRIGWLSAEFYESWANLFETQERPKEALRILDRGLKRKAEPKAYLLDAKLSIAERNPTESMLRGAKRRRSSEVKTLTTKSKKMKVFLDSVDSSDTDEPKDGAIKHAFPYVSKEDCENKPPVNELEGQVLHQLHTNVPRRSSTSTPLRVFRDDSDDNSEPVPEEPPTCEIRSCEMGDALSRSRFPELMLLETRQFAQPIREFDPVPQSLVMKTADLHNCATGIIEHLDESMAHILYVEHVGYTERIPDQWGDGPPTEQLH